jgi:Serine dehydrogenase proteinase
MDTIKCNHAIEMMLNDANRALADRFQSEVIFLKAPMRPPVDNAVRDEIEELKQDEANEIRVSRKKNRDIKKKLTVIVETNGGYVETVERIVGVFRRHYETVEYIVPNYAYSAGTILVLSGDELYMDYYSVLGPIDPQIEMDEGGSVPGMGYLAKFEELVKQINERPAEETRAQLNYLIERFDPAKLFTIEQAIEHSKSLLKEWLPRYKFKSWTKKETTGTDVTDQDRQERADQIASVLGDAKRWHSHGRGVGMKELLSEEIKLKIINYGDDVNLYRNISHYYGLYTDYLQKCGFEGALHSNRGLRRLA